MKKNREVLKAEIRTRSEKENVQRGGIGVGAIRAWEEFLKLNSNNYRAATVKQEIQAMKVAVSPKKDEGEDDERKI